MALPKFEENKHKREHGRFASKGGPADKKPTTPRERHALAAERLKRAEAKHAAAKELAAKAEPGSLAAEIAARRVEQIKVAVHKRASAAGDASMAAKSRQIRSADRLKGARERLAGAHAAVQEARDAHDPDHPKKIVAEARARHEENKQQVTERLETLRRDRVDTKREERDASKEAEAHAKRAGVESTGEIQVLFHERESMARIEGRLKDAHASGDADRIARAEGHVTEQRERLRAQEERTAEDRRKLGEKGVAAVERAYRAGNKIEQIDSSIDEHKEYLKDARKFDRALERTETGVSAGKLHLIDRLVDHEPDGGYVGRESPLSEADSFSNWDHDAHKEGAAELAKAEKRAAKFSRHVEQHERDLARVS